MRSCLPALRIARRQDATRALGPGTRAVVWFQGCSLSCPGCIAASMNASPPELLLSPRELAGWVTSRPGINGVTLSGGDPFDQPLDALAAFLEEVRATSPLNVLLYTGRTLDQLHAKGGTAVARVLAAVDILVDGPYVAALNDGIGWRGSSNQKIHVLGNRVDDPLAATLSRRRIELEVSGAGVVQLTGMPGPRAGRKILESLERIGRADQASHIPQ